MTKRLVAALAFLALLPSFLWSPTAEATLGVGVTARSISIDQELRPGQWCRLPKIGVANTGDEEASYAVAVTSTPSPGRLSADPSWFRVTPKNVDPDPGHVEHVSVSLRIPVNARQGRYVAFIRAALPGIETAGNPIIVGAGTKVEFTVAGKPLPEDKERTKPRAPVPFWSWRLAQWVVAGVLALGLLGFVARNLRISVRWRGQGKQ